MTPGAPQGPAGPAAPSLLRAGWQRCWLLAPGFALAGVIALAATFVSRLHSGPQLLYALLFGVAFNYLVQDGRTRPGIDFSGRLGGMTSATHGKAELDRTVDAFRAALRMLRAEQELPAAAA